MKIRTDRINFVGIPMDFFVNLRRRVLSSSILENQFVVGIALFLQKKIGSLGRLSNTGGGKMPGDT